MRKNPETITVLVDGKESTLKVIEYHPLEPSNYVLDPGWTCIDPHDPNETEYFVSESGSVWKQPENREIGIAKTQSTFRSLQSLLP